MEQGLVSLLAAATLFGAGAASAQPLGTSGQVVLGVDRLFGYSSASTTVKDDSGSEVTTTLSGFSLLGNYPLAMYSLPRLSVDFLPTNGLTIGGSVMYAYVSGSIEAEGYDEDIASQNIFLIGPRVGYAYMFSDNVGIWPRAGVSYVTIWSEDEAPDPMTGDTTTVEDSQSETAINLDVMLVLSPAEHVGLTVGPTVDIGLGGTSKTEIGSSSSEVDVSTFGFGVQAGLIAWF